MYWTAYLADDGIDTRIHGIKIRSMKEKDLGLSRDLFIQANLIRFPLLQGFALDELYRRALLLKRRVTRLSLLFDFNRFENSYICNIELAFQFDPNHLCLFKLWQVHFQFFTIIASLLKPILEGECHWIQLTLPKYLLTRHFIGQILHSENNTILRIWP